MTDWALLICPTCARAHGVEVIALDTPGKCDACGVDTLDRRRVISEDQRQLVTPIACTCVRCRHEWRVFPYELAREAAQGVGVHAVRNCPRCRHPREIIPPRPLGPVIL